MPHYLEQTAPNAHYGRYWRDIVGLPVLLDLRVAAERLSFPSLSEKNRPLKISAQACGSAHFVHGCFWHGHDCARGARVPKTNRKYWLGKIGRNRIRDARSVEALERGGWRVMTVW